jgi:hypothetical protein
MKDGLKKSENKLPKNTLIRKIEKCLYVLYSLVIAIMNIQFLERAGNFLLS